ncbi:MAG: metal-dependent hydrolase [Phycisphaerales bacterium]|nr:metal-dependent hydrolase [Phycisphaerales bacterium]
MSAELTFLGHSGILYSDGEVTVAVDPFLTGNPVATMGPDDVRCTHVALTHGHEDHFGDTVAIAKANDATVVGAYEIVNFVASQGVEKGEPGNPGGRISLGGDRWIAFTHAFHSSSYEGQYMGMPCGLVLHLGGKTIYHCGDTGLFSDMALIGELYSPSVALIPIGDRFTMGPELASRAADLIGAPTVIPIHYNTWPPIEVDVSAFAPSKSRVHVMQAGDTFTVE